MKFFPRIFFFVPFVCSLSSCGEPEYDAGHVLGEAEKKQEMKNAIPEIIRLAEEVKKIIDTREKQESVKGKNGIHMEDKIKNDIFKLMNDIIGLANVDDSKKMSIDFNKSIQDLSSIKVNSAFTVWKKNESTSILENTNNVEEEFTKNMKEAYDKLYRYMDIYRGHYTSLK